MDDPLFMDDGFPAKGVDSAGGPRKRASHTGDQMKGELGKAAATIVIELSDSSKDLAQARIDEAMSGESRRRRGRPSRHLRS